MPPKDPQNNNPNFEPLKVDIDPVFKGNQNNQNKAGDQENSPLIPNAYNVLTNQKYTPTEQESSFVDNTPKTSSNIKSSIHTYRDDIQSAIQANHLSSVNIAIAENDKMRSQLRTEAVTGGEKTSAYSKNKIFALISVFILVIVILAVIITYSIKGQNSTPVVQTQIPPTLITTEYKDELNTSTIVKDRFASALSSRLNDVQIPVNNIYTIYTTNGTSSVKSLVSVGEFITLTGLQTPDTIKRTLTQNFMVGMYSFGQNLPFVIFKTSSFENTFAGMLDWEKTLEKDFTVLFRLNNQNGGGLTQALTPSVSHKFEDGVIANQDVRLLRGEDKKITFLYAILNKDTIIITVNDVALKEIINRLNKEKGLKR